MRWTEPEVLHRLELFAVEAGMALGPFVQLAARLGARAAVERALTQRVAAPSVPAGDTEATARLDGIVAGRLGSQLEARRAIRMGRVTVAGVVVFDPSVAAHPTSVAVDGAG